MVSIWASLLLLQALPVFSRGVEKPRRGLEDKFAIGRRQADAPDVESYRQRAHHSVAVLDGYLYIVGGEISQYVDGDDDSRDSRAVYDTLSIPLDEQWDPSTVSLKTIKGGDLPTVKNAALWVDYTEKRLYSWGGEGPFRDDDGADEPHLWVFVPDDNGGGTWSVQDPDYEEVFDRITRGTAAGYATCGSTAYSLGGYANRYTDEELRSSSGVAITSLSSFNMVTKAWAEHSTKAFNDPYGTYFNGEAVCGDLADSDPFFVPIGGMAARDSGFESMHEMGMSNITFYHPDMHGWHWQHTRGGPPPPRINFCAVGARGTGGSYEIFIYGGLNPTKEGKDTVTLDDVWVLSIPAFEWFQVDSPGTPRAHHDCAVASNNSQMIVVGGIDRTANDGHYWGGTDEWKQGLGIFDMHELKWRDSYDPEAPPYEAPAVVREWYEKGGMDTVGWDGDDIEHMFADFKLSSAEEEKQNEKPTGAIVGGSIAGVIGLLGVSGLIIWLLRRRRREPRRPIYPPREGPERGARKGGPRKNTMELEAYGHRDRQRLPTQELDGSHYRDTALSQELDGGWAAAEAAVRYSKSPVGDSKASKLSAVDPYRRNAAVSPEIPGADYYRRNTLSPELQG